MCKWKKKVLQVLMNTCICFDLTIFFKSRPKKTDITKTKSSSKNLHNAIVICGSHIISPPQKYLIDRIHLAINSYETENELPTLMSIL